MVNIKFSKHGLDQTKERDISKYEIKLRQKSDSLFIRFNKERYFESDEVKEDIIIDYNKKGKIIGIEILNASKKLSSDISKNPYSIVYTP